MKVITEKIIREELKAGLPEVYTIPDGKILSPAAREFLQQCQVRIEDPRVTYKKRTSPDGEPAEQKPAAAVRPAAVSRAVPEQPAAQHTAVPRYVDEASGSFYYEKPEHMTQLHGNFLVEKDDPRISFRGKLDSVHALVVWCQSMMSANAENAEIIADLGSVAENLTAMMRADVLNEPFTMDRIIGLSHEELRERSHDPRKFYNIKQMVMPDYRFGPTYAMLNYIRTQVRELEVAAVSAYRSGKTVERTDLIQSLNRMSSAVHIMMCKYLSAHQ